jgi:hypothetical protein
MGENGRRQLIDEDGMMSALDHFDHHQMDRRIVKCDYLWNISSFISYQYGTVRWYTANIPRYYAPLLVLVRIDTSNAPTSNKQALRQNLISTCLLLA